MPVYDYKCPNCGKELNDLLVTKEEKDNVKCENCGQVMSRKVCCTSSRPICKSDYVQFNKKRYPDA